MSTIDEGQEYCAYVHSRVLAVGKALWFLDDAELVLSEDEHLAWRNDLLICQAYLFKQLSSEKFVGTGVLPFVKHRFPELGAALEECVALSYVR